MALVLRTHGCSHSSDLQVLKILIVMYQEADGSIMARKSNPSFKLVSADLSGTIHAIQVHEFALKQFFFPLPTKGNFLLKNYSTITVTFLNSKHKTLCNTWCLQPGSSKGCQYLTRFL